MYDNTRLSKQIEFIMEIDRLKSVYRQSVLSDGSREENDAEHSWHLAVMAMVLYEYANDKTIDLLKVLKMVLVHDLVEIDAGDTFIYDTNGYASKEERENKAAERIFGLLPKDQELEFKELWSEFELRKTRESKFAAVLDRLEPLLLNSKTNGHTWQKFGVKSSQVIEKNAHTKEGSLILWQYINNLINECIEKGYLDN